MILLSLLFFVMAIIMLISEQKKKESDEIDRDAIAHRLKQDVVSVLSLVAPYFLNYYTGPPACRLKRKNREFQMI